MKMTKEEKEGLVYSVALHGLLLLLAFFIFVGEDTRRFGQLAVTLGEFKTGTPTQYSIENPEVVATSPNPSPVDPVDPKPESKVPTTETKKEVSKPVEAPKQTQKNDNELIKTPETKQLSPQQTRDRQQQQNNQTPKTQQAPTTQQGAQQSGDIRGNTGSANTQQGTGKDPVKSGQILWDGDIQRTALQQPKPEFLEDREATIRVRIDVAPTGRVSRVILLTKMSPVLEREIKNTLLNQWRFQPLPSGVPQVTQSGVITFNFKLD